MNKSHQVKIDLVILYHAPSI